MFDNSLFINSTNEKEVSVPRQLFDWYSENNNDEALVIWDKRGRIIYLSNFFNDYTSLYKKVSLEDHWSSLFPETTATKIRNHFKTKHVKLTLLNQSIKESDELFNLSIDCLLFSENPIFLCLLKNKTYIHHLEKKLIEKEKSSLAAQLSAGLVHDIRNPLTSLRGFLQLVQAGVKQKEEFYQVMIEEVDKLEKITNELLQAAKPFSNDMKKENINNLLKDVVLVMNVQSNFRHIDIQINSGEYLFSMCNATQIKQILINLILNAMESMEEKGIVWLYAHKSNDFIQIDIVDEGIGVEDDILKEMQEPFFTTKETGTGLGLAITKHLLDLHQAKLEVKRNHTKGSTFTIFLPAVLT